MSWSSPPSLAPAGAVMRYPAPARIVVVVLLCAAVAGLVALSARSRGEDGLPRLFLALVVVALAAAAVDVFGTAHRLRGDGIERGSPWSRRVLIRWAEVSSLQWVERTGWFEVRSRRGDAIRVYQQLGGMASFARAVLDGVPAEVIDARPGLRHRLEQLARGEAPPAEPEPYEPGGG